MELLTWTYTLFTFEFVSTLQSHSPEERIDSYLDVLYWEVKPFIFENENGEIDGIIPRIIHQGETYCNRNRSIAFMSYRRRFIDRESFQRAIHSDAHTKIPNVTKSRAFWTPVISKSHKAEQSLLVEKEVTPFQLFKTSEIAVIVPRYMISLPACDIVWYICLGH